MSEHDEFKVIFMRLPHIARRMLLLLGSVEFNNYIDQLFFDTRGGTRRGLPSAVASAIFKLYRRHSEEFPETICPIDSSKWSNHN